MSPPLNFSLSNKDPISEKKKSATLQKTKHLLQPTWSFRAIELELNSTLEVATLGGSGTETQSCC